MRHAWPQVRAIASICLAWSLTGCGNSDGDVVVATPDRAVFEERVYPILLRDCAMSTCHGAPDRWFRVVGPGRVRREPDQSPLDPATAEEIRYSYDRARSMLVTGEPVDDSRLLTKPLDLGSGGAIHDGIDAFGRDVYPNRDSEGFTRIRTWATSAQDSSTSEPLERGPQ